MSLERFVYCSRATFPAASERGLHPEVGRILMQSRRNNPRDGLVGGLYFANGWFFQCVEGPRSGIDALFSRLKADRRHGEIQVLARDGVAARRFSRWSMKFVPDASEVRALLGRHGLAEFEPMRFDAGAVRDMVDLLIAGSEAPSPAPGSRAETFAVLPRPRWVVPAAIATITALVVVVVLAAT